MPTLGKAARAHLHVQAVRLCSEGLLQFALLCSAWSKTHRWLVLVCMASREEAQRPHLALPLWTCSGWGFFDSEHVILSHVGGTSKWWKWLPPNSLHS